MATATLYASQTFPAGTVVSAYPEAVLRRDGPPTGDPVESATVAPDSSLTFFNLESRARYWAVAQVAGVWRWVGFSADTDEVEEGTVVLSSRDLTDALDLVRKSDPTLALQATSIGVAGVAPASRPTYSLTNIATDRALNGDATTLRELLNVVGTVVADLRDKGFVI